MTDSEKQHRKELAQLARRAAEMCDCLAFQVERDTTGWSEPVFDNQLIEELRLCYYRVCAMQEERFKE